MRIGGERPARFRPRGLARPCSPGCRNARTCSPGSIAENVKARPPGCSPRRRLARARRSPPGGHRGRAPERLETRLGDHGSGLSAGERQRLALARAFLRDAPLLLLDEPTAALDGGTEADVIRAVRRLVRGRTVILVAHRPALLSLADRVIEFAPAEAAAGRASETKGRAA